MTHVLWYNLIFIPLVQLEAINLNYKNLIVTTILENIHLFPELLISGIVCQITLWRLILLMNLRIVLINTGLIKMLFMIQIRSKRNRRSTCLCLMLCYLTCGQRGIPAPVTSHWIGLDCYCSWEETNVIKHICHIHTLVNM